MNVLRIAWTQSVSRGLRGLSLAREKSWALVWDDKHWLYLLNHAGAIQAQRQLPGGVASACSAEDGSAYAVVSSKGELAWLAPDLMPRWERSLPNPGVTVALDSFGQYLAVSDTRGNVQVLDRRGRMVTEVESPRPLHYLEFVPSAALLVGAADYGLVACMDLSGRWVWRDGLVAHVGSLSIAGDGSRIVLACFSEGLHRYDLAGKKLDRQLLPGPVRLASLSFEGHRILAFFQNKQVHLLDGDAHELGVLGIDRPAAALALAGLGDSALVALGDGSVLGIEIRR